MTAARLDAAALQQQAGVRDAIASAAQRTGVDFTYLFAQAKSESGLNPSAQAGSSSAAGLYQFIDQSWLGVLKQHGAEHGYGWAADRISWSGGRWTVTDPDAKGAIMGLRKDPTCSSLMAAEFASDNADGLAQALGRTPSSTDLYFAHFLGLHGASRFLKATDASPDSSAAALFPKEAAANQGIFYTKAGEARSLGQVYALMGRKLTGAGAGAMDQPVQMASAADDKVKLIDLPPSSAAPDGDGGDLGEVMTALAGQTGRFNLLRPDPKTAMLAYRLIAASMTVV